MTMTIDILKSEALKLKKSEMLEFVSFLVDALRMQEPDAGAASDTLDRPGISPKWEEELRRRSKELEDGTATLISLEELQTEINQIFGFELKTPQPRKI
jgi:hypothetical protein